MGQATLARYAEVVHAGRGEMRGATAPRLLLEVLCARLLLPSASDSESALLQRVERIETRLEMAIPAGEASASVPPPPVKQYARKTQSPVQTTPPAEPSALPEPPEPATESEAEPVAVSQPEPERAAAPVTAAAPTALDATAVRTMWPTVRDKVRDRSRSLFAMLDAATVRAVDGDTLVLAHQAPTLAKRLTEQPNAEIIREALKDALGVDWKVRWESGADAAGVSASPPQPEPEAAEVVRAEEDELIAEAVRDAKDPAPRRDPEVAALELLQSELGARPIGES